MNLLGNRFYRDETQKIWAQVYVSFCRYLFRLGRGFFCQTLDGRSGSQKLLEEIISRFGLPLTIGSDNGPAFVSSVSQALAKAMGMNWKLHRAYWPQSSGQVERMNQTLKETLTKLILETGSGWVDLLPLTLLWV